MLDQVTCYCAISRVQGENAVGIKYIWGRKTKFIETGWKNIV